MQQFGRLPQTADVHIQYTHCRYDKERHNPIGKQCILQDSTGFLMFTFPEEFAHDRCQAVRKTSGKYYGKIKDIVYKAGCSQIFGTMPTHHECIGE